MILLIEKNSAILPVLRSNLVISFHLTTGTGFQKHSISFVRIALENPKREYFSNWQYVPWLKPFMIPSPLVITDLRLTITVISLLPSGDTPILLHTEYFLII